MKKIAIIAVIVVLIDQISKYYIKTHFELGESVTVFEDWFQLVFVENPGMAYGMHWGGIAGKIGLTVMRWILIGWGIWFLTHAGKKYTSNIYFVIPAALILAGALGNVIDSTFYGLIFDSGTTWNAERESWMGYFNQVSEADFSGYAPIFQGCVVDMLHFPLFDYTWPDWIPSVGGKSGTFFAPVFNVADTAISIGGIFLLLFKNKALGE
ncbi:MAG: lipoprotein signal peptidase [Flavobacteriaceae bacterium]|nr:lipoprotein signal peptidase [Flavobacteriaceae bacterium]